MAEYLANAVQNVALDNPVLFSASIPCTKGYIYHEDETGVFILRGCTNNCFARYQVTFNGNIAVPEEGETYTGTVKSILDFGAFIEFMPGKEGLLHISEIDWRRFETMEETGIKEGDKIDVKLLEIDPKTGKFKLSAKVLKEKPEGYTEPERRPRPERPERGERRPRPERPERGERRPRPENNERPAEQPAAPQNDETIEF